MLAITGITGHTGGCFLDELIAHHYRGPIRCLVRSADRAGRVARSGLDAEILEGDLASEDDIRALLMGADTVMHIFNIHFSPEILRIGRECGVRRFILVHTTGVFSRYKSASREYIEIENIVLPQMEACNVTVVRPTMIFGDMRDYNISKFIRLVDRFPVLPVIAGGHSLIQPVNARDLGKALYRVMNTPATCGKAYNLSGQRPISIRELYGMIAEALGKKRLIVSAPMGLCVFGARLLRILSLGRVNLVEQVLRMGEDRSYSHEEAARDFDYNPEPFEIGLQREVAQYIASKQ